MQKKTYKGLATVAVGSLLVTGLGTAASANTLASQASALQIVTGSTGTVSSKFDGTHSTIKLHAVAPASVNTVTFSYRIGVAEPVTIGQATRNDDGTFSLEWAPGGIAGSTVELIAEGSDGSVDSQNLVLVSNTVDTVNVTDANDIGIFDQPYGAAGSSTYGTVSGTASAPGDVRVRSLSTPAANPQPATTTVQAVNDNGVARWDASVDLTGYTNDTVNQFAIEAEYGTVGQETTDTEAYTAYRQIITTVTAVAKATDAPSNSTTPVTVTVLDQNGKAIRGARVSNGTDEAFTGIDGKAEFVQAAGTSLTYYADTTAQQGQQASDVAASPVTVGSYTPDATSFRLESQDGTAFDRDEYTDGDVTVVALDQRGNEYSVAQDFTYYWTVTGADGTVTRYPATGTSTASPANGEYVVPLPAGGSGTYTLYGSFETGDTVATSKIGDLKVGQAALVFDDANPEQAPVGGVEDVTGKLQLEDGTALANRDLTATYVAAGNSGIRVAGQTGLQSSTTVKTGTDGSFTVRIEDPATPTTPESGVLTLAGTGIASADRTVEFREGLAPARIVFLDSVEDATPGTVQSVRVRVEYNATPGAPTPTYQNLSNQSVELTTDRGYFTDGKPVSTATGTDVGAYTDLGKTTTVKTDGNGVATFLLTIGRDTDFDDDATAIATLRAVADSVNESTTASFSTDYDEAVPLNGGTVSIEFTEDERVQDSTVLPKAELDQTVTFDLRATDQFGNPVLDAPVEVRGESIFNPITRQALTDLDSTGDLTVSATRPESITYTVEYDARTTKYDAAGAETNGAETLTDSATVDWYEAASETSTYTVEDRNADSPKPGELVQYVFTVEDEAGQPVQGATVELFYANQSRTAFTNARGVATVSFTSDRQGTVNVSATVTGEDGGQIGQVFEDSVMFGSSAKVAPGLRVAGVAKGNRDVVNVKAIRDANGATAILEVRKGGKWVRVGMKKLNDAGDARFVVRDRTKAASLYRVRVKATPDTKAAVKRVRVR